MPESYREPPDAEYRNRIRRLDDEIQTLKRKECSAQELSRLERLEDHIWTLRSERLKNDIRRLQAELASTESFREAESSLLEFLRTQPEAVDEDRIQDAVQARRATIQKTLRMFVDDGKVKRSGAGRRGDPYRYQIAGTPVPDMDAVPENEKPKEDGSRDDESANASTGGWTSI